MKKSLLSLVFSVFCMIFAVSAHSQGIGQIKKISGQVAIERAGASPTSELGASVYLGDVITTGADGSVGLLFDDDSRIAIGPNSTLVLDNFVYDPKTSEGNFDVSIRKGTLSAISGKLTEKRPGAMKVKTPAAILAVRGTEFSVKVDEPK